jgi:microcystin-dependent protein
MSDPYVGEIRMFGGNFAPQGWLFCEGQTLAISENETLFTLIGTTYGGNGQSTFALPDLRGRVPIHQGQGPGLAPFVQGQKGGVEQVTLTTSQYPAHSHVAVASSADGTQPGPGNNYLAGSTSVKLYNSNPPVTALNAASVGPSGGSQPHANMQPFLCISFIIALAGYYPPHG